MYHLFAPLGCESFDIHLYIHTQGVCLQDNVLWDTLTAREHLTFYGQLKNLRGAELRHEIVSCLKVIRPFL
jgi:ABC-type Na+ transport system ATPase subunit NatA